jgi:hypothetical protein
MLLRSNLGKNEPEPERESESESEFDSVSENEDERVNIQHLRESMIEITIFHLVNIDLKANFRKRK